MEVLLNLLATNAPARQTRAQILIGDGCRRDRRTMGGIIRNHARFALIREAADGAAVLAEIDRSRPDLILLDLRLPDMDGAEVLDRVRARYDREALAVIIVCADQDGELAAGCLAHGANAYVLKPICANVLRKCVAAELDRSLPACATAAHASRCFMIL